MPFVKGNTFGKANKGRKKESKKTLWVLESLQEHGFDFEATLVRFLDKAAKGDKHALEMAHLLVKLVPHIANAPKSDAGVTQIETLVINRFDASKPVAHINASIEAEVEPPSETSIENVP